MSANALSKSLRERSYVKYKMVPKAISILGCRGLAIEAIRICEQDAKRSAARGHRHVARLLRECAAIYRVAARRLRRPEGVALGYAFGGNPRLARQVRRSFA